MKKIIKGFALFLSTLFLFSCAQQSSYQGKSELSFKLPSAEMLKNVREGDIEEVNLTEETGNEVDQASTFDDFTFHVYLFKEPDKVNRDKEKQSDEYQDDQFIYTQQEESPREGEIADSSDAETIEEPYEKSEVYSFDLEQFFEEMNKEYSFFEYIGEKTGSAGESITFKRLKEGWYNIVLVGESKDYPCEFFQGFGSGEVIVGEESQVSITVEHYFICDACGCWYDSEWGAKECDNPDCPKNQQVEPYNPEEPSVISQNYTISLLEQSDNPIYFEMSDYGYYYATVNLADKIRNAINNGDQNTLNKGDKITISFDGFANAKQEVFVKLISSEENLTFDDSNENFLTFGNGKNNDLSTTITVEDPDNLICLLYYSQSDSVLTLSYDNNSGTGGEETPGDEPGDTPTEYNVSLLTSEDENIEFETLKTTLGIFYYYAIPLSNKLGETDKSKLIKASLSAYSNTVITGINATIVSADDWKNGYTTVLYSLLTEAFKNIYNPKTLEVEKLNTIDFDEINIETDDELYCILYYPETVTEITGETITNQKATLSATEFYKPQDYTIDILTNDNIEFAKNDYGYYAIVDLDNILRQEKITVNATDSLTCQISGYSSEDIQYLMANLYSWEEFTEDNILQVCDAFFANLTQGITEDSYVDVFKKGKMEIQFSTTIKEDQTDDLKLFLYYPINDTNTEVYFSSKEIISETQTQEEQNGANIVETQTLETSYQFIEKADDISTFVANIPIDSFLKEGETINPGNTIIFSLEGCLSEPIDSLFYGLTYLGDDGNYSTAMMDYQNQIIKRLGDSEDGKISIRLPINNIPELKGQYSEGQSYTALQLYHQKEGCGEVILSDITLTIVNYPKEVKACEFAKQEDTYTDNNKISSNILYDYSNFDIDLGSFEKGNKIKVTVTGNFPTKKESEELYVTIFDGSASAGWFKALAGHDKPNTNDPDKTEGIIKPKEGINTYNFEFEVFDSPVDLNTIKLRLRRISEDEQSFYTVTGLEISVELVE